MTNGWIKLYRSLLHWEWSDVPEMVALWVRLLIMATHEEQQWHGKTINRGQLVTTYLHLSEETGITMQQLRTCLDRLKKSGQITMQVTNKYSIITICKYDSYQEVEEAEQHTSNTPATHQQHTSNTPATSEQHINKNDKNIRTKERKNINNPPTPLNGEAPKPTVSKMEKATPHAATRYDSIFEEEYQRLTGSGFIWAKRENIAVNSIVGKIVAKMEKNGKFNPTDKEKEDAFRWFIVSLYQTGDTWIMSNFTPHVICDKFNENYETIKNTQNGTRKQTANNPAGVSQDYAERVARELAG